MYDIREKAARDHQWLINGARKEGRQEGRLEGREEGRLYGTIRTCQSFLGIAESSEEDLQKKSLDELRDLASQLQITLRGRMA